MIINGDSLHLPLGDKTIQCCVTSPPYFGLRDYGVDGQIGNEKTPEEYISNLVNAFREVKRVLNDDGVLWVNIGDCYAGSGGMGSFVDNKAKKGMCIIKNYSRNKSIEGLKPKDLIGIPWMLAFALRNDGWYLRQDIIWSKPNPMPESVRDRCTKSHEYVFLLSKNKKYYYDSDSIKESANQNRWGGKKPINKNNSKDSENIYNGLTRERDMMPERRNKRSVWGIPTKSYKGAHFATFPEKLIEPCILAGSRKGDVVLDPFSGAGTTGVVSAKLQREYVGVELNKEYVNLSIKRISNIQMKLI